MPNATENQIKERLQAFVAELDALVRKNTLDSLREILDGSATTTRRGRPPGVRRGPGRPKGSARGGDVDAAAAKIVAYVRSNDGQGISAIASATGVAGPVAKKVAKQLLASGQLKKSGQKRGTVYHIGSGRAAPTRARKAGKRVARKGKRKGRKKPSAKKAVVIPARKRPGAAKSAVALERKSREADVVKQLQEPQALAGGA